MGTQSFGVMSVGCACQEGVFVMTTQALPSPNTSAREENVAGAVGHSRSNVPSAATTAEATAVPVQGDGSGVMCPATVFPARPTKPLPWSFCGAIAQGGSPQRIAPEGQAQDSSVGAPFAEQAFETTLPISHGAPEHAPQSSVADAEGSHAGPAVQLAAAAPSPAKHPLITSPKGTHGAPHVHDVHPTRSSATLATEGAPGQTLRKHSGSGGFVSVQPLAA